VKKVLSDQMFTTPENSRLTMLRTWVLDNQVTAIVMNERQFWNFAALQPVAEKPWATFMGRAINVPDMPEDAQRHLGIFDKNSSPLRPSRTAEYPTRGFRGVAEIAIENLGKGTEKIDFCCFGLAGPVVNGKSSPTNLPWTVDAAELTARIGARTLLINDLEANAYGIAALDSKDLAVIEPAEPGPPANAAVISAGTGLGFLFRCFISGGR